MAHLLKAAYQLRSHRFGAWALDRWAVTLAWGAVAIIVLQWVLRGRPVLPPWHWLVLGLLLLAGGGLLGLRVWAARRRYVVFTPEAGGRSPEPRALAPDDKVALRATGRFEVEGRAALYAHLQAYWRTFATGEHAVMAIRHAARFLLFGPASPEQLGMWYMFIPAEALEQVTPGRMAFGTASGPALRLIYRCAVARRDPGKPPKLVRETAYLMFEDEQARTCVWADLCVTRRG